MSCLQCLLGLLAFCFSKGTADPSWKSPTAIALTMAHYCPGYLRRGANIYHREAASKHAPAGVMRCVTFAHHMFVELLRMKGSGLFIKHCTRQGWAVLDSEMPPKPLRMPRVKHLWDSQGWAWGLEQPVLRGAHPLRILWQKQKTPADQKCLHWKQNTCVGFQLLKPARNMTNYSELWAEVSNHGLAEDHVPWTSEEKIQSFPHHVP